MKQWWGWWKFLNKNKEVLDVIYKKKLKKFLKKIVKDRFKSESRLSVGKVLIFYSINTKTVIVNLTCKINVIFEIFVLVQKWNKSAYTK